MMKLIIIAAFLCIVATTTTTFVSAATKAPVDAYIQWVFVNQSFIVAPKSEGEPANGSWACHIVGKYSVNQTGFNEVTLTANPTMMYSTYQAKIAYQACGFAEGYYFWQEVVNAAKNVGMSPGQFPEKKIVSSGKPLTKGEVTHNWIYSMWTNLKMFNEVSITGQSTPRFVKWIEGMAAGVNAGLKESGSTETITALLAFAYSNQGGIGDFMTAAVYQAKMNTPAAPPAPLPKPNHTTLPPSPPAKIESLPSVAEEQQQSANAAVNVDSNRVAGVQQQQQQSEIPDEPEWLTIAIEQRRTSHCSALVRLTKDDLMFSHVTWNMYRAMGDRVLRTINYENSVYFSSYIGMLPSTDDWLVSEKLAMLETTLVQQNSELTGRYLQTWSIPASFRSMAVILWARYPSEANRIMLYKNGGDYANTWIFVARGITSEQIKNKTLPSGSVWITEAIPGYETPNGDETYALNKNGYIMGDNIAYFPRTYALTYEKLQCQQGSLFCQTNYSRAEIFKRNITTQGGVQNIAEFKRMMRYNRFETDPLSVIPGCPNCNPRSNPQLSISNRADLVPTNANFAELYNNKNGINNPGFLSRSAFGGIDAKMISFAENMNKSSKVLKTHVIAGPTTDDQPAFSWTRFSPTGPYPAGAKLDDFNFPWFSQSGVELTRSMHAPWPINPASSGGGGNPGSSLSDGAIAGIVIGCVAAVVCVAFAIRAWRQKRVKGVDPEGTSYKVQDQGAYQQV